MLLPFTRAASSSFLSRTETTLSVEEESKEEQPQSPHHHQQEQQLLSPQVEDKSLSSPSSSILPVTLSESSHDEPQCSRTKILVVLLLCVICAVIVMALLMLEPLETLDVSRQIRPLWRFSTLGGWEIQVIAIRRNHV